jgi:hypothetical protein
VIAPTPPVCATVLVLEDLHATIDAVLALEHCRNIAMIEYRREFGKVRRDIRSRMDTLDETHRTLTRILENQNLGSIALERVATSNSIFHNQLSRTMQGLQELVTNEDARCAQMAEHRQRMDTLNLIIQQVGERITAIVNQNLMLDAQIKGIRTTIKTVAAAVRTNITNFRGPIILDLHSALVSLKSKVLDLHDLSVSLKSKVLDLQEQVSTIRGTFTSTSQAHPPLASDATTPPPQPDGMP